MNSQCNTPFLVFANILENLQPTRPGRGDRDDPNFAPRAQGLSQHERAPASGGRARRHDVREQDRAAQRRLPARELVLGARELEVSVH